MRRARTEQQARAEYRTAYRDSYRTFAEFRRARYPNGFINAKPNRPVGHMERHYVIIDATHANHWPAEFSPQERDFEETDYHRRERRWSRLIHAAQPPIELAPTNFRPPVHGAGHVHEWDFM